MRRPPKIFRRRPQPSPYSQLNELQRRGFWIGVDKLVESFKAEQNEARQRVIAETIHQKLRNAGVPPDEIADVLKRIRKE